MSWNKDWHFLKYAGAPTVRQMYKQQRAASQAVQSSNIYEKPLDSPDRPSNILRSLEDGVTAHDIDNPSTILKANGEFKPPADAPPEPLPLDVPGAFALPPETAASPQPEETGGQIVRQTG